MDRMQRWGWGLFGEVIGPVSEALALAFQLAAEPQAYLAPPSDVRDQGRLFWMVTCGIFLYSLGRGIGEVEIICSSIISPHWDLARLPESLSLTRQGP